MSLRESKSSRTNYQLGSSRSFLIVAFELSYRIHGIGTTVMQHLAGLSDIFVQRGYRIG